MEEGNLSKSLSEEQLMLSLIALFLQKFHRLILNLAAEILQPALILSSKRTSTNSTSKYQISNSKINLMNWSSVQSFFTENLQ
jgi:hypothetical protein